MARLEQVITTMVEIFTEYADNQGHKRKLCKDELKALLLTESENPAFKIKPTDIDEVMKTLDKNGDDELNFREFCRCVTILAVSHYHTVIGKGGKGKGPDKAEKA